MIMKLSHFTSIAALVLVIVFQFALAPAIHEAGHCMVAWSNGMDTDCEIVLAHPSHTFEDKANYAKGTAAFTEFDSHLIIMPVHMLFLLGSIWLAGRRVIAAYT